MEVSIVNPVQICVPWKRSKLHDVSETYGLIPQRDLQTINHFNAVHVNTIWLFYNDRSYAKLVVEKQRDGLKSLFTLTTSGFLQPIT